MTRSIEPVAHPSTAPELGDAVRRSPDCSIVIFGASGDLTRRKLVPGLYNLDVDGLLGENTAVVGFARREKTDDSFRTEQRGYSDKHSRRGLDSERWDRFAQRLHYVRGDLTESSDYVTLRERLESLERERGIPGNRLFYLSTPPSAIADILHHLSASGLACRGGRESGWCRIVIEKPFGSDRASAGLLDATITESFDEQQIYRIDHYLGKETVQNLLVLRLGNGIFEPLWNRRYIECVQITVAESLGIGTRAAYFENAGILRDMLQSHVLQLLTLVAMEPPSTFAPEAVRDEKAKVLRAIEPMTDECVEKRVVRAQYLSGSVGGDRVRGYLDEEGVAPDSMTDTYIALRLGVENWRWAGVPFYIRIGKRLPRRLTEIVIRYRQPPLSIFRDAGCEHTEPNTLVVQIQPDEGIAMTFGAKVPGPDINIEPVQMLFTYDRYFGAASPEAYERLILDALHGDATLFARSDEVDLSWKLVDRIRDVWQSDRPTPMYKYVAGTAGPTEADRVLLSDDHAWRSI